MMRPAYLVEGGKTVGLVRMAEAYALWVWTSGLSHPKSQGLGKLIYATPLRKRTAYPWWFTELEPSLARHQDSSCPIPAGVHSALHVATADPFCLLTMSHVAHTPLLLSLAWSFFIKFTWQTTWPLMNSHSNPLLPSKHSSNANSFFLDVMSFSFNSSWDFLILSQCNQPSLCLLHPSCGVHFCLWIGAVHCWSQLWRLRWP